MLTFFPDFSFPGCCAQQMFREEPQYTEVNPGANAELRCVIENIGGECRWQKDGKVSLEPVRDIQKTKPPIHEFKVLQQVINEK